MVCKVKHKTRATLADSWEGRHGRTSSIHTHTRSLTHSLSHTRVQHGKWLVHHPKPALIQHQQPKQLGVSVGEATMAGARAPLARAKSARRPPQNGE